VLCDRRPKPRLESGAVRPLERGTSFDRAPLPGDFIESTRPRLIPIGVTHRPRSNKSRARRRTT